MTDAVEVALIVSVAPTLVALGAVWLGWLNRTKLTDVGHSVDGRLTELLELTRKSSHAEGVRDGKQPDA